jgi:hypothetical protein
MSETTTKVLFLIVDQGVEPDVMDTLKQMGLNHYTSWTDCSGSGETGTRQGTAVWPGLNTVILLVLGEELVEPLVQRLHEVRDSFPTTPGLKIVLMDGVMV